VVVKENGDAVGDQDVDEVEHEGGHQLATSAYVLGELKKADKS
jgi:hypothetical protein